MNARYYDPHLGSFITPDPSMSGLNHYAYCSANPIRYTDPTGLDDDDEAEAQPAVSAANAEAQPAATVYGGYDDYSYSGYGGAGALGATAGLGNGVAASASDRDGDGKVEPWEEFYNRWDASIAEFNRRCDEIAANLDERDANFAAGLGWKIDEQLGKGIGKSGVISPDSITKASSITRILDREAIEKMKQDEKKRANEEKLQQRKTFDFELLLPDLNRNRRDEIVRRGIVYEYVYVKNIEYTSFKEICGSLKEWLKINDVKALINPDKDGYINTVIFNKGGYINREIDFNTGNINHYDSRPPVLNYSFNIIDYTLPEFYDNKRK